MDLELIERLLRMLEDSEIDELEVEDGDFRVRLQKQAQSLAPPTLIPVPQATAVSAASPPPTDTEAIETPMVGTFYRSPAPDAAPYVEVGDTVGEDTVVCIVEAMKVMNEIKAGLRGTIAEVLVENAQPVEFGQPLFRVKPSGV